jgi:hypothetical protein
MKEASTGEKHLSKCLDHQVIRHAEAAPLESSFHQVQDLAEAAVGGYTLR